MESDLERIAKLIEIHTRRLQNLKEKQARYGISTPSEICTEIEDIDDKLEKLKKEKAELERNRDLSILEKEIIERENLIRETLIKFFDLDKSNPTLKIYLSRHSAKTDLPRINIPQSDRVSNPILERIYQLQKDEDPNKRIEADEFAVVSAIEMIEALRLKDEIERNNYFDLPLKYAKNLIKIKVSLEVCPKPDNYKQILINGTSIFIGGPRANLGTYYYLYGEKAGIARPRRLEKEAIEDVNNPNNQRKATDDTRNLAIIQKHRINKGKTIFYLAGTGVSGTAAAVAYLRMRWINLFFEISTADKFVKILDVARRETKEKEEDIASYISKDWTPDKWKEVNPLWEKKIIIFTDLDGTLLDEFTYSTSQSVDALKELQAKGISIVFCSSKTRAEQEFIRQALNVTDPFIVENGSAVIVPPNSIKITTPNYEELDGTKILTLGKPIKEIRSILETVKSNTGVAYESFFDISDERVSQITGLDLEAAQRAKTREFSETIVTQLNASESELFKRECELYGLQCTMGGRFLSVTGKGSDKGSAVQVLTSYYKAQFDNILTIGIGDSPNDEPMLQNVDIPYLVQRTNGQWRNLDIANLRYLPAIGPLGFTEMVKDIMQNYQNLI